MSNEASGDQPSANALSLNRRNLFLELASCPEGTTVTEVYQVATSRGDSATVEAFHNIARRLAHSGVLAIEERPGEARRYINKKGEAWLDERELSEIIDPDYPIAALAIWREAVQNVRDIPESVWVELRERLLAVDARALFHEAITSYCDDLSAQIGLLAEANEHGLDFERGRKEAEQSLRLLTGLTKFGLGLSREAVRLPLNVDLGIRALRGGTHAVVCDSELLREELARRVEPGSFVRDVDSATPDGDSTPKAVLVGAVDGSTRGGVLSLAGADGDFAVAHAPLVSINTAVGQVNRKVKSGRTHFPAFLRLPERPEDMQRDDNRHTVMAKLLHPDLTDAQYMHAVWNAMDLVETRATLRLLHRWYADGRSLEVPPADVVLRDGTVSPQDRDFSHYREQDSYGRIVRDMIDVGWRVALACREDRRVVCGVVKQTQLSVFAPVINWYACRLARDGEGQLLGWPLDAMNAAPDQLLVTRLLTASRKPDDQWQRTCVVMRPFHALTNYGLSYSRAMHPADQILMQFDRAQCNPGDESESNEVFWAGFQAENDPYVRTLRNVQYGNFFLAAVPRLDNDNVLPRIELLVVAPTAEGEESPWPICESVTAKTLAGIRTVKFDVSGEHDMFSDRPKLDVLPALLISTHDLVKTWALELVGRVQEFVGYQLARYVNAKKLKGVRIRPFTRAELKALYAELRAEREREAGARRLEP